MGSEQACERAHAIREPTTASPDESLTTWDTPTARAASMARVVVVALVGGGRREQGHRPTTLQRVPEIARGAACGVDPLLLPDHHGPGVAAEHVHRHPGTAQRRQHLRAHRTARRGRQDLARQRGAPPASGAGVAAGAGRVRVDVSAVVPPASGSCR